VVDVRNDREIAYVLHQGGIGHAVAGQAGPGKGAL
jgi:hypothetical protein